MPKFKRGDKVWYVPVHAEDATHKDAKAGVIVDFRQVKDYHGAQPNNYEIAQGYLVDYDDDSPNAKLTYERHLQKRDSNNE